MKLTYAAVWMGLLCLTLMGFRMGIEDPEQPWMRYPAISPDGSQIAFCYKGNIYLAPVAGGVARPLTLGANYDYKPVWSPDGQQIAFASDRHGNFDVFVMPASGGAAQRLTFHSTNDVPTAFSADGSGVLFTSQRLMNVENVQFPYGRFQQLHTAPLSGERPRAMLPMPLDEAQPDAGGQRLLYIDHKGYEDVWRKHHTSSVTRDIWMYDKASGEHTQLTTFEGEDRNPVWSPDGTAFYYLSQQGGSFNIWKASIANPGDRRQISRMERHPVRFLSVASNGTLCFGYHGGIYTMREGAQPRQVNIRLPFDQSGTATLETLTANATEMTLSPNGKELAFVVRGEVFVTGVESGLTKRITNTPGQERSVRFSPDGRKLVYAGERDSIWNLYESRIVRDEEPWFYGATLIEEKALLATPAETFQPAYSPDGKEVAFLEERTTLRVLNLASGQSRTVLPGEKNYSYSDGDQHYAWSPDSKWFLVTFIDKQRWMSEVGLVKATGSEPVINLTQSGYGEGGPTWALDGKAMIYTSDRQGFRSHGSWGAQSDVYAMFFDQEAWDRFSLSKDAFDILKEQEKDKDKNGDSDKDKNGDKDKDKKKEVKPLKFDLAGAEDRIARLTLSASFISDFALAPDGEKLYYLSTRDNSADLWEMTVREKKVKTIGNFSSPGGSLALDEKGEYLYILNGGGISRVKTADGSTTPVSFKAEMYLDRERERDYFFEHMWRQVDRKFYVEDLHDVDWEGLKADYAPFLPHITHNRDFAEMMSELLGELNGSHTGCRYFHNDPKGDATASLAFFEDPGHTGPGVRIAEVMDKSPLRKGSLEIKKGMIIEKIDGIAIGPNENYFPLLNHKAGKKVHLSIADPASGKKHELIVEPISLDEESNLLYERWVKARRSDTDRLSGGRLGYVHVRGMNSPSFREVYSELLGRYNDREAVIVDTRFNGGGWLHDDLATLLSGEQYVTLVPRGQVIGSEPQNKWQRPSVVLVGEGNYSDAHFFPVAYRALGIGPIIGMPVPGTTTAVWWERQIDPTLVFGIPQVGVIDMHGRYLENLQLEPDVEVKLMPNDMINGRDTQLEKAVDVLMQDLPER